MKCLRFLAIPTAIAATVMALNANADDAEVIANLKNSKISLLEDIGQAEKTSGPALSAKFEMDDDNKLSLSVYTAPQGLNTPAESNDLTELSGNPTEIPFAPKAEIFKDKEHIARASAHLTIMQLSKFTLSEIIQKAVAAQPGMPYSVADPQIRDGEPVVDVFIADANGKSAKVTVNVQTGGLTRY
ncbi:MAG: hypothetical protein ACREEP_18995 [Dongiaceae bacterium]